MDFTKMRPFQIVFMAGFALLAFVGLFMFANYSGFGGGKATVGEVTIWGTLPADRFEQGLSTLVRAHKEYGNVTYVAKSASTFETDLAEALASGKGPDLILITQEQLLSQTAKITHIDFNKDLTERAFRDSYVPIFEKFITDTGTYGIPFAVDPLIMYYNRDLLANAGVAEAPKTWEAVTGLSALLTKKLPDQTVEKSLIAFGEYDNVTNARAVVSLLLMQAGSRMTTSSTGGVRASLAVGGADTFGITPAESALNFYTQFANPSKTVYSWNRSMPQSRQAFLAGDVALYPGFASERSLIRAGNPNLNFDIAVMPQPQTADKRITYGLAYAFAIPKASDNVSGAYQVAIALAAKDMGPQIAAQLGMAPALRAYLKPAADDAYGAVYLPEALIATGWLSPAPRTTDAIFSTMIGNITSGRRGTGEALLQADQALDAAL